LIGSLRLNGIEGFAFSALIGSEHLMTLGKPESARSVRLPRRMARAGRAGGCFRVRVARGLREVRRAIIIIYMIFVRLADVMSFAPPGKCDASASMIAFPMHD